jgi:hypothetical protein
MFDKFTEILPKNLKNDISLAVSEKKVNFLPPTSPARQQFREKKY